MNIRPVLLLTAVAGAVHAQEIQPSSVGRIVITPAIRTVSAGDTVRFSGQALNSAGDPMPGVKVRFAMVRGEGGDIDTSGVLITGSTGVIAVSAVASIPGQRPKVERFDVRIMPGAAARIEVTPQPTKLVVGQRLLLSPRSWSAQNDERKNDEYTYTSSAPRVVRAGSDGSRA